MAVEVVVYVVMQKLSALLDEESELFKNYPCEIRGVMEELREMECCLNIAKNNQQSNPVLTHWAPGFLGLVYSFQDVIESYLLEETRKRKGFIKKYISVIANEFKLCREVPDTMDHSQSVPRLISKMEGFSKEIKGLLSKEGSSSLALAPLQDSHTMRHHEQPWQESHAYYAPNREDTTFKEDVQKLLKEITSDSKPLQIISVFGEIGIRDAAHIIYNNQEVKNEFNCRALVGMKTNWSCKHVLLDILRQVTSMDIEKLNSLMSRFNKILEPEKYLIVINDVVSLDLLENLRSAFPDANNGSRVVITTHDEEAASFADAPSRYHYKLLDMEYGLIEFKKEAYRLVKERLLSVEIEGCLKEKIADICRGNPLRIKLLAGFLSAKEKIYEDWSSIDKQLDFAKESPSFDILAFAYNDLPLHLKPCFLYLGFFQERSEISVRRLVWLWLAEGFVKPSKERTAEDIAKEYLEELVQRNMVEISQRKFDGSPKTCRMTVSLHDIFRPRAAEIDLLHLHRKSRNYSNATKEHQLGVRQVTEEAFTSLNNRKKDILLADGIGTLLESITGTRGFALLKVLDLEGVKRLELPRNLGSLLHMRYLGLRFTCLKTLPSSLGDLLHLQTLDIKHTQIKTVPSFIWNMKHLRHLCLNGARLDIPLQQKENTAPSQLQTLQGLFLDEKTAGKISSNLERMTSLRKLDLTIESSDSHAASYGKIDLWISSLSSLRSLQLRSMGTKGQPSQLNMINDLSGLQNLSELYLLGHLPQSLDWYKIPDGVKALTLSVSQLKEDPMPALSKLSKLTVLRLLATSYVGEEMCFPEKGFPALQILKLWKLENLKKITVEEGTMQKLQTLEIRCCEELKDEEVPDTLLNKKELRKLILTNMPKEFVDAMKGRKEDHKYEIEVYPHMEKTSKQ